METNDNNKGCCCCHGKTKHRTDEEQKALINRLNRIEGQIRGIKRMLEEDAYCTDIITQVAGLMRRLIHLIKSFFQRI